MTPGVQLVIGLAIVDVVLIFWLLAAAYREGEFESRRIFIALLDPGLRKLAMEQLSKSMYQDELYNRKTGRDDYTKHNGAI